MEEETKAAVPLQDTESPSRQSPYTLQITKDENGIHKILMHINRCFEQNHSMG